MKTLSRGWMVLLLVTLILGGCSSGKEPETPLGTPIQEEQSTASTAASVPKTTENPESQPTPAPTEVAVPDGVLLGVYPAGFLYKHVEELVKFDQWLKPINREITIAATFMDFEEGDAENFVPKDLDAAWERGYVPFVNLSVGNLKEPRTSEHIAEGYLDEPIRAWARAYAAWSANGGKRAFIAPLQEMNGYWTTYGGDAEAFKGAYHRIQKIFQEEGVKPEAVSWVFAPNGWSQEGYEFEKFYPGDEVVDVVAFSSFNFGECSNWPKWESYEELFKPYLERMTALAPEKPIFIAETGTVAEGGDKDQWLKENFQKLAAYPNLRAILYFNRWEARATLENCPNGTDYRVFNYQTGEGMLSFLEAVSSMDFIHLEPGSDALNEMMDNTP